MRQALKRFAKSLLLGCYRRLHERFGPCYNLNGVLSAYWEAIENIQEDSGGLGEALRVGADAFVDSCRREGELWRYAHTPQRQQPNLYSSVHACLIFSITGRLQRMSERDRAGWRAYFDAHQTRDDGLFRDPVLSNRIFEHSDWWGARHLTAHIVGAYAALGDKPRHPLSFLSAYTRRDAIGEWLARGDWRSVGDFDNQVMNIGTLLQYSRDAFGDSAAADAVRELVRQIEARIDSGSGLVWPSDMIPNPTPRSVELSRAVQYSYHLFTVAHYDGWRHPNPAALLQSVNATASPLMGFGPELNSSACEDIDSIDLLCRYTMPSDAAQQRRASRMAAWVLTNRNSDGGFVFRRGCAFEYGHGLLGSGREESHLFATWFRLLSLAYLQRHLRQNLGLTVIDAPGYAFERGSLF